MSFSTFTILAMLLVFLVGPTLASTRRDLKGYKFDLDALCRMDTLDLWVGGRPDDLSVGDDGVDGGGCLQARIDLDPGEYVRIEHLFLDGFGDVGANLHGLNEKDVDLSACRTITFACKGKLSGSHRLVFRIWDRFGGWLEWNVPSGGKDGQWRRVTLSVPSDVSSMINLGDAGGVVFELRADEVPLNGRFWLDDLKLLNEPAKGLAPERLDVPSTIRVPQIHSTPLPDPTIRSRVHVLMFVNISKYLNEGNTEAAIRELAKSVSRFQGMENIEFWFYAGEFGMFSDPNSTEVRELLPKVKKTTIDVARWCEQNDVPFYMGPGHIVPMLMDGKWMSEILDAAPNYCLGMFLHEFAPEGNNGLEQTLELLEVLRTRGKKMILNNQTCYWFVGMHSWDEYRAKVLNSRYKDTFVPMWENLLPAAQGMCMGGCLGYWRAGRFTDWGVSVQSWTYTNMNYGVTDQMPVHWWMRMMVSAIGRGATYIEIEPDWPFNGQHLGGVVEGGFLLKLGEKSVPPLFKDTEPMKALRYLQNLVSSGALAPAAKPQDSASISPVALQAAKGPGQGKWGILARGVDTTVDQAYCPTAWDMSCQPARCDIFRKLYKSMQYFDQTFPITHWGLLSIVPMEDSPTGTVLYKTDGRGLLVDGKWLEPEIAEPIFHEAFVKASRKLLFTAENCTLSAIRVGKDDYQVMMMDPEARFPRAFETVLRISRPGAWQAVDAITGCGLGECSSSLNVAIPAGGFRIIRIRRQR